MRLLRLVQRLAWGAGTGDFLDAVRRASGVHRVGVVLLVALLVMGLRRLLRLGTAADGHGGGLAAAIWFRAGHLPPVRTLLGAVGSVVAVGLGAALGREAAPKEAGAVLGGLYGRGARLPPTQRRLLVACGAGAGMAAVYDVPLGGALFALEVLLGTLSLSLVAPALLTSLLATAAAWLLLPPGPTYNVPFLPSAPSLLMFSLLAGPLIGLAAVLYVRMICWADVHRPKGAMAVAVPLAVYAALGLAAVPLPQMLGNGRDLVQLAFAGTLPLALAAGLALLRPLGTAACLGAGTPGGLFTPTLTVGALLGLAGGGAWAWAVPRAAMLLGLAPPDPGALGAYAMVAAGALLAATTQGPVSAIVLLLELTRRLDTLMVPLMLAVAGAVVVARRLEGRSVYSGRIHMAHARAEATGRATVSAAARSMPALLQALRAPSGRLVVLDEDGTALGTVTGEQLADPPAACRPTAIATARDVLLAGRGPA